MRLRDAISRSLTLVYSTGRMVQVTLPDLGSPLVCSALAAVKVLLPRDLALLVHSSWYTARHAPGPPPSPDKEWRMFQSCLLSLAGYQVQYRSLRSHLTIISDTGAPARPFNKFRAQLQCWRPRRSKQEMPLQ